MRPSDTAARYGGEEFVVVLPEAPIAHAYAVINWVPIRVANAQRRGTAPSIRSSSGSRPWEADRAFGEIVDQTDVAPL
jgi:GGDEF domain-containing protein